MIKAAAGGGEEYTIIHTINVVDEGDYDDDNNW